MTGRDRIVVVVVALAGIAGGFWFLALSPRREEASALRAKVTQEHQRLAQAQAGADAAVQAKAGYDRDYATLARLGQAVPVDDGVSSLIYQLELAARGSRVDFRRIELSGGGGGAPAAAPAPAPTPAPAAPAAPPVAGATATAAAPASNAAPAPPVAGSALPPGATVGAAGFPTLPFSFVFTGSFFDMERFLRRVGRFVRVDGAEVRVRGRLLSIDGFALETVGANAQRVRASISATAYLLPADQGLAAGATAQGPGPVAVPASTTADGRGVSAVTGGATAAVRP